MYAIEKVDLEHIERIRPMWQALIEGGIAASPYFADRSPGLELEASGRALREKLERGWTMVTAVLVDRETGQDAGFVTVTYDRAGSTGEVEMLFLKEAYRGQGLGRRLLEMALSTLDIHGIRERRLRVTCGSEAALRLCRSCGFYPFAVDCLQKR